jgi:hypothetical protein
MIMDNDFEKNLRPSLFLGYEKPIFELDTEGRLVLTNIPVPEPSMWVADYLLRYLKQEHFISSGTIQFTGSVSPC